MFKIAFNFNFCIFLGTEMKIDLPKEASPLQNYVKHSILMKKLHTTYFSHFNLAHQTICHSADFSGFQIKQ